jgi:hypothetical protein
MHELTQRIGEAKHQRCEEWRFSSTHMDVSGECSRVDRNDMQLTLPFPDLYALSDDRHDQLQHLSTFLFNNEELIFSLFAGR